MEALRTESMSTKILQRTITYDFVNFSHSLLFQLGPAANRREDLKIRLMCYSLYAWGGPAIVVLSCVTVDQLKEGATGYG